MEKILTTEGLSKILGRTERLSVASWVFAEILGNGW